MGKREKLCAELGVLQLPAICFIAVIKLDKGAELR
jgi:hypothetical protein